MNLWGRYLKALRESDEITIRNHSTTWAIAISIIILFFVFQIWGTEIFDFNFVKNFNNAQESNSANLDLENSSSTIISDSTFTSKSSINSSQKTDNDLESPFIILKNFWNETSQEFGKIQKEFLAEFFESKELIQDFHKVASSTKR